MTSIRQVLATWLATRWATALLGLVAVWAVFGHNQFSGSYQPGVLPCEPATPPPGAVPDFTSAWRHWDADNFIKIAQCGYQQPPRTYTQDDIVAYFPGMPAALWLVHWVVPNWTVAGVVVSLVAGAFAAVALARLTDLEAARPAATATAPGRTPGNRAVLYLALSPFAVFLFTGYSEALFLGFALPAWLAARRGHWLAAGVLAGFAASVRITGVFLGMALIVEYAVQTWRAHRDWAGQDWAGQDWAGQDWQHWAGPDLPGRDWMGRRGGSGAHRADDPLLTPAAAALLAPFAVTVGYFGYVHALTGDWLGWFNAQSAGWHRALTTPWTALKTTWQAGGEAYAPFALSFRAEIASMVVGLILLGVLLWLRRWAEAVYVGVQVASLGISEYYLSIGRATLLWFPLWILLGRAGARWRWVHYGYLACAAPLMAAYVVTFVGGGWVD